MVELHQSQVRVSLHRVCALFSNKLVEFYDVSWSLKFIRQLEVKSVTDDLLIVPVVFAQGVLKFCSRIKCVKVWVEDGLGLSGLQGEQICSQNHLAELIVLHVLETGSFLSAVNVAALGGVVDVEK